MSLKATPLSWFGWCKRYHRWRLRRLTDRVNAARASGDLGKASKLREALLAEYPSRPDWILPTAFGNRIRGLETYSYDVYRADAIVLWPRLMTVVPKEFVSQIDNARCQVDFLVSLVSLGWVVAAIAFAELLKGLSDAHFRHMPANSWQLGYEVAGGLLASLLFYRRSVGALGAWGETIKTVSDCYLPALAASSDTFPGSGDRT